MDPLNTVELTVDIVKATSATYEALQCLPGLPKEFKQVSRSLPLVQETLSLARDRLQDPGTDWDKSSKNALGPPISLCREKAEMLREVFENIRQGTKDPSAKDRSGLYLYRKCLRSLGKAYRIEKLMEGILKDLGAFATNSLIQTATESQMAQLKKEIEQLSKVESSVPDSDTDGPMNNSQNIDSGGTGYMSVINGQGHHINPGSGQQYIAQTISFAGPGEHHKTWREMIPALCRLPYEARKNRNPERVEGTCAWFVGHRHFQRWRDSTSSSMLWVSANPGSGKSVLARYLVDKELESSEQRTVCYFFFKDDFEDQRTATSALSCILHQLFSRREDLVSDQIAKKFDFFRAHLTDSLANLWEVLVMASQNHSAGEIVCVLDAFDECDDQERSMLARLFRGFYNNDQESEAKLKFLITSRPYDKIGLGFQPLDIPGLPIIHLKGESGAETTKIAREIDIYIEHRVSLIQTHLNLGPDEKQLLLDGLRGVPNQTYLWVTLTLDLIEDDLGIDKTKIRKAMCTLPQTLDDAYEKILAKSIDSKEAKKLLHIVVAAARPLTLSEINIAMSLGPDHSSHRDLSCRCKRFERYVRDLCGLFVTITDSKIYLLHQTAKEFLVLKGDADSRVHHGDKYVWRRSLIPTESHGILFQICSWHLLHADFITHHLDTTEGENAEGKALPCCGAHIFLDYSATNWAAHFRASAMHDDNIVHTLQQICDARSERCQNWLRAYWKSTQTDFPRAFTTLMIASYFGIEQIVRIQLKMSHVDANAMDETYQRSALSWASENGHDGVVRLLLKGTKLRFANLANVSMRDMIHHRDISRLSLRGITNLSFLRAVTIDTKDKYGRTPLSYAAWHGHMAVVERLINIGARADIKDDIGGTPISYALVSGQKAVVDLMRTEAQADSADKISRELLISAAEKGHEDLVKLLLDTGVQIESKDRRGSTPLCTAVENDHEAVVKLLLEKGASVDLEDDGHGVTLVHDAIDNGHEAIVRLLLEKGTNVHLKDSRHSAALLFRAASYGHEAIVKLLLDKGTDINLKCNEHGDTTLHYAVSRGDKVAVKLLLEKGASIDPKDNKLGSTPLHYAVSNGHEDIVRLLLEKSASIDLKDDGGGVTPLHHAAADGHEAIVKLLLEKGASVNLKCDRYGATPLHRAVINGHEVTAKLLLGKGADVASRNKDGATPLHCAVDNCHEAIVKLLLEQGAGVHLRNKKSGARPLHCAAVNGHKALVKLLLESGAGVDSKADDGDSTPLHLAASKGHEATVKLLLESGASIDSWDKQEETALHKSAYNGHEAITRLLLENGANVNAQNMYGETSLHLATHCGHEATVKLLLESGIKVDSRNKNGETPLWLAAKRNSQAVARLLLDMGAHIESRAAQGGTTLHVAARYDSQAVIRLLLDRGADVNAQDMYGATPLHMAAKCSFEATIKLLLESGAKVDSRNKNHETPLWLAAKRNSQAVARLLLDTGAHIESRDGQGETTLHVAARYNSQAVIRLLLDRGVDVNAQDMYGATPLHMAAHRGHEATIKLLLDRGADVNSQNAQGLTPLHFVAACREREADAILLLERGAQVDSRDDLGRTPLWMAAHNNKEGVARLLLERGAKADSQNELGMTPLRMAADKGYQQMAKMLAAAGAVNHGDPMSAWAREVLGPWVTKNAQG